MSLTITLRVNEELSVDKERYVLAGVVPGSAVVQRVADGTSWNISKGEYVEVSPDVWLALGDRSTTMAARIAVDAPPEKLISRPMQH